jgi:hypothetical protein
MTYQNFNSSNFDQISHEILNPLKASCQMVAIGKPGKKEDLPEMLRDKETPSDRKPLKDLIFHGKFGQNYLS